MPNKTFHVEPARQVEGDPFGLHDPLTMDDLERIERALADGSVTGAHAERLRAIRDDESARFAEAFKAITARLTAQFGNILGGIDVGPKFADLMPKIGFGLNMAEHMPKVDLGPSIGTMMPTVDIANLWGDVAWERFGPLASLPDFGPILELPLVAGEGFDPSMFLDERPAHMQELAERQLKALDTLARAVIESDERAERRFEESKRMNRSQTRVVVVVTIVAALLGSGAGAVITMLLQ
jgi:hypothetical protein